MTREDAVEILTTAREMYPGKSVIRDAFTLALAALQPQQRAADAGGTAEDGWGASLHDFPLRHWESMRSLGISWDAKMGCCIADLWLRMVKL